MGVKRAVLQELKGLKEELQARNRELEKTLLANEGARAETAIIRLKRQISSSGIDSILGVLRCLNNMGLKVRTIQSEFSVSEFLAALEIEPKVIGQFNLGFIIGRLDQDLFIIDQDEAFGW